MLTKTKKDKGTRTDSEIARDIVRRMKEDYEVPDNWITVKVADGFVTIAGTVSRDAQKDAAEACARKVKGVGGIVNRIEVEAAPPPVEA